MYIHENVTIGVFEIGILKNVDYFPLQSNNGIDIGLIDQWNVRWILHATYQKRAFILFLKLLK